MQQQTPSTPSQGSSTFAGLLASLTAPEQKRAGAWNDDDLAEDVATLSYERALRAHSRYKAPALSDEALNRQEAVNGVKISGTENGAPAPMASDPFADSVAGQGECASRLDPEPAGVHGPSVDQDRGLKSASITIRLSREECEQLRKRAAEAGLTVSAYMRSCTFEAESLRALVKETLAQLREPTREKEAAKPVVRRSWRQRLAWIWPRPRVLQNEDRVWLLDRITRP